MKTFVVYEHKNLPTQFVKQGWGWPAFFFMCFWALVKRMWSLGISITIIYIAIYVVQLNNYGSSFDTFTPFDLLGLILCLVFGIKGNQWRENDLLNLGYKRAEVITTRNITLAEAQYSAKSRASENKYSDWAGDEGAALTVSSSFNNNMTLNVTLPDIGDFDDVKVIEVLLSKGDLINENDSIITLENDKATMEIPAPFSGKVDSVKVKVGETISKGDLIATFEVNEVIKTDKEELPVSVPIIESNEEVAAESHATLVPVSNSDNQSDYVAKLKEAKTLLDEGTINENDYEKIKNKVIDNM